MAERFVAGTKAANSGSPDCLHCDQKRRDIYYSARLSFSAWFRMQLNCILLAVQLLAIGKLSDFAL